MVGVRYSVCPSCFPLPRFIIISVTRATMFFSPLLCSPLMVDWSTRRGRQAAAIRMLSDPRLNRRCLRGQLGCPTPFQHSHAHSHVLAWHSRGKTPHPALCGQCGTPGAVGTNIFTRKFLSCRAKQRRGQRLLLLLQAHKLHRWKTGPAGEGRPQQHSSLLLPCPRKARRCPEIRAQQ